MFSNKNRKKPALDFTNCESKVQENMAIETNINNIVDKMKRGVMPKVNGKQPMFGDFTNVSDYHTMLNQVIETEQRFMKIDPKIRKRFDNDPQKLIEFLENAENFEEAYELGIIGEVKYNAYLEAKKAKETQTLQGNEQIQQAVNQQPQPVVQQNVQPQPVVQQPTA